MNEQQTQRLASNEELFRTVNEQMVGLNEAFEPIARRSVFICECSRVECVEQLELTLAEYAEVRSDPLRFLVAPSGEHVAPEIETIVERTDRYFVVEKHGLEAEASGRLRRP